MGPFRRLLTSAFHLGSGIIYPSILDSFSMANRFELPFFLFQNSFLLRWIPIIATTCYYGFTVMDFNIQSTRFMIYISDFFFREFFATRASYKNDTNAFFFFGKKASLHNDISW